MKTYKLSGADAFNHKPENPERTARRNHSGLDFDVTFQVWPNRKALAKTVRFQQRRETRQTDWKPCVPLAENEGF